jgi:hypothetical protein
VSNTAQYVYLGAAILTLALLATFIGTHLALAVAGVNALTADARLAVRFLLLPGIFGEAVLYIAMWYFWFGFDRSHYSKKALWFFLLFLLPPVGTLLYYFLAYRRGVRRIASDPIPANN